MLKHLVILQMFSWGVGGVVGDSGDGGVGGVDGVGSDGGVNGVDAGCRYSDKKDPIM